eukprot:TRINITY_DN12555_c0_g1_i1.p1 TRINITY_DN12555_c0_g1~~TRINITY_DN12555_c0_g1_i1.p1  ORF type:complete len:111 (-),score=46.07 TRINITY_DN12555_c0_g1_i1:184-516(-)
MIRRPPRSTQSRSSAASDVYKRQTLSGGFMGNVPHVEAKVVGDRGTSDAKILAAGSRGNLKIKGPHVSSNFYNNAGLLSEMVDGNGFVSTSREAVMTQTGAITYHAAQVY